MIWMNGAAKRQCDRALLGPRLLEGLDLGAALPAVPREDLRARFGPP
jgi:hypothetical protein